MDWTTLLEPGETLRWQGRPAPRCWTFRNWRHACFGGVLLLFSLWWQKSGIDLAQESDSLLPLLLPLPFVLAAAYLAVGQLLLARWEWNRVCFAVSERRVLATRGVARLRVAALPLAEVSYYQVVPYGEHLATIRIHAAALDRWCVLHCVEHPELVTPWLDAALAVPEQAGVAAGEFV